MSEEAAGLGRWPRTGQWALLLLLSVLCVALVRAAHLPAAFLLGPMFAAIACGAAGASIRPAKPLFAAAQAVVGVLIAHSIEPSVFRFFEAGRLRPGAGAGRGGASSLLGYLISRWRVLPGTTAVWGSSPGASTAMVLMAEAFGADARLVAFMQYLRVIMVSAAAALVAALFIKAPAGAAATTAPWLPMLDPQKFGATLSVALAGGMAGKLLRLPSPFFLGSMIVGIAVHLGLGMEFQLPPPLLAASYAVIGWRIGLSFTRPVLAAAARALPQVAASILVLMSVCGLIAFALHKATGLDPLTAYLATSPGGMDSVAIIAAASGQVNLSFVMALQTARFLVVLLLGPAIARLVARRLG